MLLLKLDGEIISRIESDENNLPQYATLSHTWGRDEVTFEDMALGTGRKKLGYRKLVRCGKQAAKDGLKFFWADTCCVDRSSSAQLSEATNKTFKWFQQAKRCYVFLADVSCPKDIDPSSEQVLSAFRSSRWFTRSWTLQELLAPKIIDFFSVEGNKIGDRKSLLQEISIITGIPDRALDGVPSSIHKFSKKERLGWAATRHASREEDEVYALLGICEAPMPLIYGEGKDRARLRLDNELDPNRRRLSPEFDPSLTVNLHGNRLTGTRFRLLIIHPGKLGSPIVGWLQEADLSDPPSYSALSYVWGEEPQIHPITINGEVTSIRPNLYHALQRIRSLHTHQFCIWVDSLCIKQDDNTEKNEQVGRMSQIYSKAGAVFVWLGEKDTTSKDAIEFSVDIYLHMSTHLDDTGRPPPVSWDNPTWWTNYNFTAVSLLLERPWFRRGWVLQEAAFSKNSMIQCGDAQIHMTRFSIVVSLVREKLGLRFQAMDVIHERTKAGTLMNFRDSPAVRMLDMIEDAFDNSSKKGVDPKPKMSLETLVHRGTFTETSDKRDAVYALLTLANDARTNSASFHIVPDYEKEIPEVYTDFIRHCHSHSGSLDILCRPWAPAPSSREQNNGLASWIAPRKRLPFGDPSWRLKHRLHGSPLVGSSLEPNYNAHGGMPADITWPTKQQPDSIYVKGVVLTDVSKRSSRMANAIITPESLEVLGANHARNLPDYIWRTLCADRDDNGEPALEHYKDAMLDIMKISTDNNASRTSLGQYDSRISIDVEELLEYRDLSTLTKNFLILVRNVVWNRRTFRSAPLDATGKHYIGLIPPDARIGDRICILYGCSVPVVLRKIIESDESYHWKLVGDVYVHGIMDGEAFEHASEEELERRTVVFHIR
jgi:hypothetical protein